MAMQNGLPSADPSAPPFATSGGLPTVKSGGGGAAMPKDRPQSEARPEVVPSLAETPKGGKVLFADPTGPSGNSGAVSGVNGEVPFKNLR
jgi:hypothetical protein